MSTLALTEHDLDPLAVEPDEGGPVVTDRFPIFKVTRNRANKWSISCLTCARAGVLWYVSCASAEEAAAVIEAHQWPCPSELTDEGGELS
jgi:hypothetical protein